MVNKSLNKNLTYFACFLAATVMLLGAYTRLTDAGLGCPDWPGCYGSWIAQAGEGVELTKAWTEMIHRYFASTLGLCILFLGFLNFKSEKRMLSLSLIALVILQGCLGMWTVTLRLYPIVVMAHLMGGLLILSGLILLAKPNLQACLTKNFKSKNPATKILLLKNLSLATLVICFMQILLGGWTSANYAALVCLELPLCQGLNNPSFAWLEAFNFFNAGILDSPGEHLSFNAKATIHMMHRFGAILAFITIGWFAHQLKSKLLAGLLCLQITLGIFNIISFLPLSIAVLHHAVALLLWSTLLIYYQHLCNAPNSLKTT